ncbi:lactate permease LctP family transporter [Paenibacillus sp. FSL K6-1330]|uniref:L-lactate permease n=1 Tax=Paenibacillus sp. FSL K6-1330 TaxID=2975292 RepID=UPI0030D8F5B6
MCLVEWNQHYDPLNNIWLSAIVATIPILFFVIVLSVFKVKGYIAGVWSVVIAALTAMVAYGMPFSKVLGTGIYGALTGVWPVAAIVLAAIFLYKLTVKTGKFEIIKESITSITPDKRIQVLLIAYCFGAFLEGAAGFGAPVAITAIILVGLGFKPINAAGICLVANIAGGSYGAMGIPVTTPAQLTDLSPLDVASYTSYIIPIVSFIVAFLVVFLVDGMKGIRETWLSIVVCGGAFALVQFAVLNTIGAVLVDILAASLSLIALTIFTLWREKTKYKSDFRQVTVAWLPFIMLTVFVILFSQVTFDDLMLKIPIQGVHNEIIKHPPITTEPSPYAAIFNVDLLSSTVTAIVLAGLLTILIYRIKWSTVKSSIKDTFKELLFPIITICSVLAFAYICNYSGMSSTLGLAFASTGGLFPLFSPVLGWIGVFLTGSVVNSGSLFAPLQAVTSSQIGIDPGSMVAANVIGGDMAKMISPQSIAVAAASVGLSGQENLLFKFTIKISLIFLVAIGIINLLLY